jgi:hypothetical protein
MKGVERAGAAMLVLMMAAACDEAPTDPKVNGGAGIRFMFPAGVESLEGVRVELWDQDYSHIAAPDCPGSSRLARLVPQSEARPDSCTRMSVHIRNWIGQTVLDVPDTAFLGTLAWPWDALDQEREYVPSGIYTLDSRCLDSRGGFSFHGYYYVPTDDGSCDWILWSEDLSPADVAAPWSIGPFDTLGKTWAFTEELLHEVNFVNPFLVRVHATGMRTFEQEITLDAGAYTKVSVKFVPMTVNLQKPTRAGDP